MKFCVKFCLIFCFFCVCLGFCSRSFCYAALTSYSSVVKIAAPAVVNIYSTGRAHLASDLPAFFDDPIFKKFFGDDGKISRPEKVLGSGILVNQNGMIVTNVHVINGAERINIAMQDGKEYSAVVIAKEDLTDLAVIKIESGSGDLPYMHLGDSDKLEVGDQVLAIGNPFGLGQTVTGGIISALSRDNVGGAAGYGSFIQTDAAINPGNSGGALVNMSGELVGLNTAIFSKTGTYVGIGFAIPVNAIKKLLSNIHKNSDGFYEVLRPWTGLGVSDVDYESARALGLSSISGVMVREIYENTPAFTSGIVIGDVIKSIDGHKVPNMRAFNYFVATHSIGDVVSCKVIDKGKVRNYKIELISAPVLDHSNSIHISSDGPFAGIVLAEANSIGYGGYGLVVVDGPNVSSPFGLQKGDILVELNGSRVRSISDFKRIVKAFRSSDGPRYFRWHMKILRGSSTVSLSFADNFGIE